jgi:phosphotransferase system enzyme I (PtsP)
MLKAAGGREMRIMFPMIATVDEFSRARAIVMREHAHLERHGYELPSALKLGVMVEVPSLLFQLDEIAHEADFMSVGSNDLMQFLFAADRENPQLADRFDPLHPACLRALASVAEAGRRAGIPVTLCGELGGRPLEAMALLAIGYRGLSMSPASIGPVKAMLLSLDLAALGETVGPLLNGSDSIRPALHTFAQKHAVPL